MPSSTTAASSRVWIQSSALDAASTDASNDNASVAASAANNINLNHSAKIPTTPRFATRSNSTNGSGPGPGPGPGSCLNSSKLQKPLNESAESTNNNKMGRQAQYEWILGELISNTASGIIVSVQGKSFTLPTSATMNQLVVLDNEYSFHDDAPIIPDDLITLTHLHEPAVVYCLQQRYAQDTIYTNTGQVLLALNPFSTIRGLYSETMMRKYSDNRNSGTSLPPHVFQIADASFRSMMRMMEQQLGSPLESHSPNQSILVSGESGAGKTVTTKFVMKYLAALSSRSAIVVPAKRAYQIVADKRHSNSPKLNQSPVKTRSDNFSIESQVLQSNPILESFGNARTVRNDNSSRFGKFIEIQFTQAGQLVGATIDVYLLEKVRLLTQAEGERNYHVYYELLSGAMSPTQLSWMYLAPTAGPEDFLMTNSGTYDRRDGVTDKETYKALKVAMNSMAFTADEQRDIFAITAACLHASNLQLQALDDDGQSTLDKENIHLIPTCVLLGVTPEDLDAALCTFSIQAGRGEALQRRQSKQKAEKGLEALIKATYGALFTHLVQRINDSIAYKPSEHDSCPSMAPAATIGVLDIFGFESFTTNSFEQLCINYCNEALQQQFNAFLLKNEQEEYEREGIEWSFIEYPENQDVLDLIDKRGAGILNILDDQCRAPGTSDKSFASDMYNKCNLHVRFQANRKQVAALQFEVHHYAGPVEYTTVGFVEKNRDELPKEATELLRSSSSMFVQHLAEILTGASPVIPPLDANGLAPIPFRRTDSSVVGSTVGGQFRRQLKDLRSKIDKTSPHYVRCLKPNDHLVPNQFDPVIVAEQLKCGGILEAVRVSRAGFTQHYPHADFVRRYRCLSTNELKSVSSGWGGNGSRASWGSGGTAWAGVVPSPRTLPSPRVLPSPSSKWSPSPRNGARSNPSTPKVQVKAADSYDVCNDLLKLICKKIQSFEAEEGKENIPDESPQKEALSAQPAAKTKAYEYKAPSPSPIWSKTKASASTVPNGLPPTPKTAHVKSRYQPCIKPQETPPPPPTPVYRASFRPSVTIDFAKVGVQMGKTKVFLRHKAFETLERIRSRHLSTTATKLNAIFRMYLSRMAYLPIRDSFREERRGRGFLIVNKEHKEEHLTQVKRSNSNASTFNLIEQFEAQFRLGFHNPVQRTSETGTQQLQAKTFRWMLVEGVWVKNPIHKEE